MRFTPTQLDAYRTLRAGGMGEADATRAMMREHGVSFDDAVDLAWMAAKGKPAPKPGSVAAMRHEGAAQAHYEQQMGGE